MKIRFRPGNTGFTGLTADGKRVLSARYLKKDESGAVLESPDDMFRRVARNISQVDARYDGESTAARSEEAFYEMMRRLDFLPNSPTLMNAGRELQQLAACFVLPVEDSLDSIFETVRNAALIHKSGGGTGFSFSRIRPKGDRVRSTDGVSSGPVSFMRVFDAATDAVKQGGTRRGANMGVLRIDHPDILEFIDAKSKQGDLKNFNISVAVTNAFMDAVARQSCYALLHPRTGQPHGHLDAREVFRRICRRAWESGDPGIIFLDVINRANPTPGVGVIECTNPCGEQPLLPFESCNLGSINLSRMMVYRNGIPFIDYGHLARTVRLAVRFLDNVIDANQYPLPQIAGVTLGNRKIGLGVMGWADLLIRLGIPYDSEQALALADKVMGLVRRTGHRASMELALKRGPFPNASHTGVSGSAACLRRNATVTTIAPTGTLSMIAGCSSGIEPLFALSFRRAHVLDGRELHEVHPSLLEKLFACGLHDASVIEEVLQTGSIQRISGIPEDIKSIYVTAHEIVPEWHVRMQAAFQKHSDNAVSKTVNLPNSATPEDVAAAYRLAYQLGCKGITVYRDRCRDAQVLYTGCVACA